MVITPPRFHPLAEVLGYGRNIIAALMCGFCFKRVKNKTALDNDIGFKCLNSGMSANAYPPMDPNGATEVIADPN